MMAAPVARPAAVRSVTASLGTTVAAAGANPSLYAATLAAPGTYWGSSRFHENRGPVGPAKLSPYAADDDLARKLWDLSVEKTGVAFDL